MNVRTRPRLGCKNELSIAVWRKLWTTSVQDTWIAVDAQYGGILQGFYGPFVLGAIDFPKVGYKDFGGIHTPLPGLPLHFED